MFKAFITHPARLGDCLLPEPNSRELVQEIGCLEHELASSNETEHLAAAVLVPIVCRESGPTMLLTKRTDHLRDHPGQISFPGGRVEPDDPSPMYTALREAEEEIGLNPSLPKVIGYLPEYRTGTGFQVTPVVALLDPQFDLRLDAFEVAETFEVPLSFLLDPANLQILTMNVRGTDRQFHAIHYGPYFIWGATAGMIVSLMRRCGIVP